MSGVRENLRAAGRGLLDLVLPPLCIVCREPVPQNGGLCPACWAAVHFLDGAACARCGMPFEVDPGGETLCAACHARPPAFDAARAAMRYDENSKGPILALKHADRLDLVPGFAAMLARIGREMIGEADIVIPVPLHRWRLWRRRYNQAAELARHLAGAAGLTCDAGALIRRRPTPSQGQMASAKARRRNMHGAFAVPPAKKPALAGKCALLVDDVMTTGATLDACAKALKRAGLRKVYAVVLARVAGPNAGI
jgi:ComF family protein